MAVVGLVLAAGFGVAGTAQAHSELEQTDPANGAQVAVLPPAITLTFNQNVLGLGTAVQVTGPAGNVADGPAKVVDNQIRQAVRSGSPAGAYTVVWRVTSADGHPISGQFTFTAAGGDGGTAPAAGAATPTGAAQSGAAQSGAAQPGSGETGSGATGSDGESGTGQAVIWLLVAGGALVVAAGIYLAARRSQPPAESDDPEDRQEP